MIEVEIIRDSIAPSGIRLTTFVLTYPRFIHSEFMTHRVFSRNASSSRAIPVKKSIQMVRDNPVIPLAFTKNKKGMQGGVALDQDAHDKAVKAWLEGRDRAVEIAERLADLEVHKQYANRVLEPWAHITVVVTATDWDNFFALRCHEAAQPEIRALADKMYKNYDGNEPDKLNNGEWHVPFIDDKTIENTYALALVNGVDLETTDVMDVFTKRSVSRCARVSYLNHDGSESSIRQDLELYDRLLGSAPLHASPAEHQAMAVGDPEVRSGNFRGWVQYRKTLKNENVQNFRK
jgi:thymidylate synthase ThyX